MNRRHDLVELLWRDVAHGTGTAGKKISVKSLIANAMAMRASRLRLHLPVGSACRADRPSEAIPASLATDRQRQMWRTRSDAEANSDTPLRKVCPAGFRQGPWEDQASSIPSAHPGARVVPGRRRPSPGARPDEENLLPLGRTGFASPRREG